MSTKKVFSILLTLLFIIAMAGCGGGVSSQTAPVSPPGSGPGPGTATVYWNPVMTYIDGSPINNTRVPTGYKIYYGTAPGYYTTTLKITISQIADPNSPRYTISGLSRGTTYYFAVSAYDANNVDSALSIERSKTIL
jgi:hypothetical protein